MSAPPPRLRLPLKITLGKESVGITDAAGTSVCYLYFDDGCPVRRSVRRRLTKEAAIEIGKTVARALTVAAEGWSATGEYDDGRMGRPSDLGRLVPPRSGST